MPEANPQSDEELVAICLSEDKEAFGILVERYEDRLSRYIRRISRLRSEDIEDLLQIVFLKVWQNLQSFKPHLKFSSWIYRIAHNETLTYIRNGKSGAHGHMLDIDKEVLQNIASEIDVFKDASKEHDGEVLRKVLAKLPQDQYDVIVLKFFEEKSYDEISDILTIPPGTVATRINRAKSKIKEIMSNNGYKYE
jgi:RNA polymerase sigma-70 factor, ECF subfamily